MLFRPFQVLSVSRITDRDPISLPSPACGVLCCTNGSGRICVGNEEIPFRQDLSLFVFTPVPIWLVSETQELLIYWIELKINHVDFCRSLTGQVLRLPCKAGMLTHTSLAAAGNCQSVDTLDEILELLLLDTVQNELDKDSPTGLVLDDRATSPELRRLYTKLRDYLTENLQNDFTAAQLADAVGYSHRQLNAILQKHSSCTISEFVSNYRIQQAKLLLLGSNYTITEIAAMVGFKSVHYFSRFFKHSMGMSPQSFRTANGDIRNES